MSTPENEKTFRPAKTKMRKREKIYEQIFFKKNMNELKKTNMTEKLSHKNNNREVFLKWKKEKKGFDTSNTFLQPS